MRSATTLLADSNIIQPQETIQIRQLQVEIMQQTAI